MYSQDFLECIKAYFREEKTKIEHRLSQFLDEQDRNAPDSSVNEAIRYSIESESKRLRGLTFLEAERLFNKNSGKTFYADDKIKFAITIAGGIECLHEGSIIMDDIQDDETVRRGKDPVYIKYGHHIAELASLAMWNIGTNKIKSAVFDYEYLFDNIRSIDNLVHWTINRMTTAQGEDLEAGDKTLEEKERTTLDKNRLFYLASVLPAYLYLEGEIRGNNLYNCAREVGSLMSEGYQLADDQEDAEKDRKGNTLVSDLGGLNRVVERLNIIRGKIIKNVRIISRGEESTLEFLVNSVFDKKIEGFSRLA